MIAILLFVYTLVGYAFFEVVQGWPSIMGTILLLGSVQLFFLGIIGEYLGRLFIQSKNRPLYVVRDIRQHERPAAQKDSIVARNDDYPNPKPARCRPGRSAATPKSGH